MTDQTVTSTSTSRPRANVTFGETKSYLYLVVDRYDPRVPQSSILKPSMVERVLFVQDLTDRNTLFALVALFKRNLAVLIPAGIFSLDPAHPKRAELDTFRDWLDENGIDNCDLTFVGPGVYERIFNLGVVRVEDFAAREDKEIRNHFVGWRMGSDLPGIRI